MTRIMTIASGMARVGKTHLAINLALEYVRRGRQVGLYHELDLVSPITEVIALRPPEPMRQGVDDNREHIVRRTCQGMDILSCGNPLPCRTAILPETLSRDFARLEIQNPYDDFLVDTSGMGPHTVLACCLASPLVTLLITPDAASQAETFALLKVLQLNGFEGRLGLVINRLQQVADAMTIHRKFSGTVQQYLGLAVPLLGAMANDEHVPVAQRSGQAVTSYFPETAFSACIQAIADNADERQPLAWSAGRTMPGFWDAFVDAVGLVMRLPGGALLEQQECADLEPPQGLPEHAGEPQSAMMLLQFEGELDELYTTLLNLPAPLRTLADDMLELRDGIKAAEAEVLPAAIAVSIKDGRLQRAAILLIRAVEPGEADLHHVQLQVSERIFPGKDGEWLQAGRYLNYEFRLLDQGEAVARMQALVSALPDARQETGPAGEVIRAWVTPARDGCLTVILSSAEGVRIQAWTAADRRSSLSATGRPAGPAGSLSRSEGKMLH
jgi:MinD-like ATPase involved in chromosome partitioning or flagellar assembly